MHARHAYVLKPDLTLMSTPNFDCVFVLRTDNVKTTLLFAFLSLIYALKNHIGCFGLFDCYHFHGETRCGSSHHSGEGFLADFALKFGEIVRDDHTSDFFLDLAVDPHLEALHVHALAGSLALAWRDEEVIWGVVIAEAELAVSSDGFSCLVHSIELAKEEVLSLFLLLNAADLHHPILNAAQFHYISQRKGIAITAMSSLVVSHRNVSVSIHRPSLIGIAIAFEHFLRGTLRRMQQETCMKEKILSLLPL